MSGTDTVGTRITTTDDQDILSLAGDTLILGELHASQHSVLLREEFEGEIDTLQLTSRNLQVTSGRSTRRYHVGIEAFWQLSDIYLLIIFELDAFFLQETETAVDDNLVELEVWNTISQQTTCVLTSLEYSYLISLMIQLVGSYQSRRTGTDDSHRLAIALRQLYMHIILLEGVLHNGALILTVGGRFVVHQVEDTSLLAECRTDTTCKLREVVGAVEQAVSQLPVALVEGIVPLRCLVAQRTSPVAERHTAVHTTARLLTAVVTIQCLFYLAKVEDSIVNWSITCFLARYSQKCFWISHLFSNFKISNRAAYPQSSAATSLPAPPGELACTRLALPG